VIYQLYITIFILSLFFISIGYFLRDNAQIFKIIGFGFMFILSIMLIPSVPGSLEYKTGTETVITENGSVENKAYLYNEYEDFTIGFFLSLASFFGFVNTFFTMQPGDDT